MGSEGVCVNCFDISGKDWLSSLLLPYEPNSIGWMNPVVTALPESIQLPHPTSESFAQTSERFVLTSERFVLNSERFVLTSQRFVPTSQRFGVCQTHAFL